MTTTSVPTTTDEPQMRAPADLERGDMIPVSELDVEYEPGGFAEVLSTHPSQSPLHGPSTLVVFRLPDGEVDSEAFANASGPLRLATDAEIEAGRAAAKRAVFVAGMRQLASWVEDRPWVPLPYHPRFQIDLHGDDAETRVREIADQLGIKVEDRLDDRTVACIEIGPVEWAVIAWHPGGRPSELVGPREPDNGDQPEQVPAGVDAEQVGAKPARRATVTARV